MSNATRDCVSRDCVFCSRTVKNYGGSIFDRGEWIQAAASITGPITEDMKADLLDMLADLR